MANKKAELLLKGRIKLNISVFLAEILGYLPGIISDDTEIPDAYLDQLLAKLSEIFDRKITRDKFPRLAWSTGSLSEAIYERQNEFPTNSA